MKVQEVYDRLHEVSRVIKRNLLDPDARGEQFIDPYEVEISHSEDPNELQKIMALFKVINLLQDACWEVEYLEKPIADSGVLIRNEAGRYELNGREFTSGAIIEVLNTDPEGEAPAYWERTRIEHDTDYYEVNHHWRLDGLMARYR